MKIVDLTQTIKNNMRVYPGDPAVGIEQYHIIETNGWRLKKLTMGSHTGTHVDAFSHMDKSGKSLSEIDLSSFCGQAMALKTHDYYPKNLGLIFTLGKLSTDLFPKIKNTNSPFVAFSENCQFSDSFVELERNLLKNGTITFNGLVNTEKLPTNRQFMFYGFPLKI
ncbi:MAG: cyclase family protein, partial [Candidatus Dojkabacteria bacterium]|nr:cyclase family protein [Candidatus Dojkabacteria bacterium]